MPAVAAHYFFGQEILSKVPPHIKMILEENRNLFHIGLQGPDILFYYKPLKRNAVSDYGHEMHRKNAGNFFEYAQTLLQQNYSDASFAYICGFLCHYILDSECHGYIEEIVQREDIGHIDLESSFDKLLLQSKEFDPYTYKRYTCFYPHKPSAPVIAQFYPTIKIQEVHQGIQGIRFYNWLLYSPHGIKFSLLKAAEGCVGKEGKFSPLAISKEERPHHSPFTKNIHQLYLNSIAIAVENIYTYDDCIRHKGKPNERLYRNFC